MSNTEEILIERAQAEAAIDKRSALQRLMANPDFVSIFIDGYCRDEAIRLVHLKGQGNMQSEHSQAQVLKQIDAIGMFREFQRVIFLEAHSAQVLLEAPEEDEESDTE